MQQTIRVVSYKNIVLLLNLWARWKPAYSKEYERITKSKRMEKEQKRKNKAHTHTQHIKKIKKKQNEEMKKRSDATHRKDK